MFIPVAEAKLSRFTSNFYTEVLLCVQIVHPSFQLQVTDSCLSPRRVSIWRRGWSGMSPRTGFGALP